MVTALLNAGANVNAADCDDVTAAHHACFLGHEDALHELLVAQPDLTLKNNEGKMPIDDAVNKGHNGCGRMLQNAALQQLPEVPKLQVEEQAPTAAKRSACTSAG